MAGGRMAANGRTRARGNAPARRRRRAAAPGNGPAGSYEVSQGVVTLKPDFGKVCSISRSLVYDWALPVADQAFLVDWSLGDVPNASEFTALFKQWRIAGSRIAINWRSANESTPTRPTLYFGVDPFMSAAPATLAEVVQRPHRTWTPNNARTVLQLNVKAMVIDLVASGPGVGAFVTNSLAPRGKWYDTSQSTVAYGVFWCWVSNWRGGNTGGSITITQDFDLQFRGSQ